MRKMVDIDTIKKQTALIDVKASGLMSGSFPVEIGWLVFEPGPFGYRDKIETYVVKPDAAWNQNHWDEVAECMHGLSIHDLKRFGHDVLSVAAHLQHFMEKRVVFTDAVEHDTLWLDMLHKAAKRPRTYEILSLTRLQRLVGLNSAAGEEIFTAARLKHGHTGRAEAGVRFLKEVFDQSISRASK
jgi:hypothetical protein